MLLDPAEDAHAVLAVHHVHGQAPLAKAASAPDPVQVGLIVRVPVLVHREIKVDDNRHLLHIDTCREGGVCEAVRVGDRVPVKAATPVLWAGERGWDLWAVGTRWHRQACNSARAGGQTLSGRYDKPGKWKVSADRGIHGAARGAAPPTWPGLLVFLLLEQEVWALPQSTVATTPLTASQCPLACADFSRHWGPGLSLLTSGAHIGGHQHLLFALSEALDHRCPLFHHHLATQQSHLMAFF